MMKASIFGGKVAAAGDAAAPATKEERKALKAEKKALKVEKKLIKAENKANKKAERIAKRQMNRQNKKNFGNGKVNGDFKTMNNKNMNRPCRVKGMKLGRRLSRRFSKNVEVVNTPKRIRIAIDLPGVNQEDLKVQVADKTHRVIISGERKSDLKIASKFSHIVPLPKKVIMSQVTANLDNGILIITAPKAKTANDELRTIPIETGRVEEPAELSAELTATAEEEEPADDNSMEMMAELKLSDDAGEQAINVTPNPTAVGWERL